MESLVFLCAEGIAERVAEDGVGFDLGGAGRWGGIRVGRCHCWWLRECQSVNHIICCSYVGGEPFHGE